MTSIVSLEQAKEAVNEIILETIGFPPNTTVRDYKTVCRQLVEVVWRDEESKPESQQHTLIAEVRSIDWHWSIGCKLMCNISLDVSEENMAIPRQLFFDIVDGSWGWYSDATRETKRLTATVTLVR